MRGRKPIRRAKQRCSVFAILSGIKPVIIRTKGGRRIAFLAFSLVNHAIRHTRRSAENLIRQALSRYERHKNPDGTALALSQLSEIKVGENSLEEAEQLAERSIKAAEESGAAEIQSRSHYQLGRVLETLGQCEAASAEYRKALNYLAAIDESGSNLVLLTRIDDCKRLAAAAEFRTSAARGKQPVS